MHASTCVLCPTPTEMFLCGIHWGRLERALGDVAWLSQELDVTLSRQSRAGTGTAGAGGGREQSLPLHLGALQAGEHLRVILASWVRDLWETNAPRVGDEIPPLEVDNHAVGLSRWLLRHPTWIQLHPAVDDLYEEVLEAVNRARQAIDRAPGTVYLGQCSALVEGVECPEDLYGLVGRETVRCRTCGTEHQLAQRRQVLLDAVEHQYVPTTVLVGLVTGLGQHLTSAMVRNLKARGRITAWVRDETVEPDEHGHQVRPRLDTDTGPDLFRVGEVLDAIAHRYRRRVA